jgi:O-antigen ligase
MTQKEKGGSNAAFFLFLFAVAVLGFGGSLQYPLAVLRAGGFGAAILLLWKRRKEPVPLGSYPLLVGVFVILALGHSFSSVYFWVSFQHAVNISLAAVLLVWAFLLFRKDPDRSWNAATLAVAAIALAEVGIALLQRFHWGDIRPRGTLDNANYLSEFLAAASILCLSRFLWARGLGRLRFAWMGGAILFLIAGLSLGGSRGVFLASVPAFGVVLVCRFGLSKGGALLAGLGGPVLLLLGFRAAVRFFSTDLFNYSRWIIWKSALRTFVNHPFGVGLGGFKYYWFATQSPVEGGFRRFWKFADTAHNEYLEVLTGLGLVGFALFLAILAYPLLRAFRKRREIAEDRRPMGAGAAGVLVLSGAHAMVNSNFHVFGIFFLDAVMLGAFLSCLPRDFAPTVALPAWSCRAGMVVCAVLLGATVSTLTGVYFHGRGGDFLRSGDLPGAERAFLTAIAADPFRASYPDALSSVHYRRYRAERPTPGALRTIPESMLATIRWEDRARQFAPRELKYTMRLSRLFFELLRLRGDPSDAEVSLLLADSAHRINPFEAEILWHKAEVLTFLGKGKDAIQELETAVSVEPNFCRGYAKLAELAREIDPASSSSWLGKEEECLGRAATVHLVEEKEKWLVESPEGR